MPNSRGYDSTAACSSRCRSGASTPASTGPPQRAAHRCRRTTAIPAGGPVTRQVIDLQPDQGALDHRQRPVVIQPGATVGQPGVHLVPGGRHGGAIPGGGRGGGDLRGRPGRWVGQRQLADVPAGPAPGVRLARRGGQLQHPVTAQPAQHHGARERARLSRCRAPQTGHSQLCPAARPREAQRGPLERCSNSPDNDPTPPGCHDLPCRQGASSGVLCCACRSADCHAP
jgi:hypothetical protein